jgi:hypothetical protein
MTCDEFQAGYLAGTHSPALDAHTAGCAACRSQLPGLNRLISTLNDPDIWGKPAIGFEDRLVDQLIRVEGTSTEKVRRRWPWLVAAAAIAAAGFGVASVAGAPDWEVDLVATGLVPDAEARVLGWQADQGTRMRFEIEGLEASGEDAYYEIWLTAEDGRHVSGGTFNASGVVEASIGVTRRDFPRVWITLEPADDDLGPSPVVVFDNPGY